MMKSMAVHFFSLLIAVCLLATSAEALPPWKTKFKEMYVDAGPASLQAAFADKVIGSCKVCHINERAKTVRNPFGIALDGLIQGSAGQRIKTAAEDGDDAKTAMKEKIDKELLAALEKVLKLPSPSGDGTYGERIKTGKLPYVPAPPNQLLAMEKQQGFELLFNGENLDGWKAQSDKHFRV